MGDCAIEYTATRLLTINDVVNLCVQRALRG